MSPVLEDQRTAPLESAPVRSTGVFRYSLEGDLRHISHHEELRMLKRALTRAGWPLRFSQGFNPQPHLVLPLPRRVGVSSECEWAVVELDGEPDPEALRDSLSAALPHQCRLKNAAVLPSKTMPHPLYVTYAASVEPRRLEALRERLTAVLNAESIVVERKHGPSRPPAPIDIRPYIETLTLDGSDIVMRLAFHARRTARAVEVLQTLDLPAAEYEHLVRQVEVEWDIALEAPS